MPNTLKSENSSSPPAVPSTGTGQGKKLLDQYSEALRNRHYSLRTEKTYISWVRQYILYHKKRHPREMGVAEINEFITFLVNQKTVSASTHTAPAVGAGGTRRSVPFFFCTAMSLASVWRERVLSQFVRANPNAFPPFSPRKRRKK